MSCVSSPSSLAVLLALAGCVAAKKVDRALEGPPDRTVLQQERIDAAMEANRVIVGMTKSEVRKVRGEPQKKDTVDRMGGKVRRWMYPWDEIYFDANGLVVGFYTAYR